MAMDPFARKMWRAGLGFAGGMLVLFLALTVVYFHVRPSCPDKLISEITSPDTRWTASILQRRCGEESPFITSVSIRERVSGVKRGFFSGQALNPTVFMVEQDAVGAGIRLDWTAPDRVTITCRNCPAGYIRRQDDRSGPVSIAYQLSPR
jgi:hypothetical protein